MSDDDERKTIKSSRVSPERRAEVAARLGFKPDEIAVFDNVDGEYAVVKDGHRLLLQDHGAVAWYGDTAPNPTYELVVPSVVLDESDDDESLELVLAGEHGPDLVLKTPPPPKHGAGSGRDAWAAYAAEHQVEIPDGATREQIIQALDEQQIPTE